MPFEVFNKRKQALGKAPTVTLQRRGILSINRSAYSLVNSPEAVELLFDPDEKIVGLREVSNDAPHGYAVRRGKDTGPVIVACTAFTQHYGIDTSVSRRYVPYVEDGILCFDLKGESVEVIGNRASSHRDDE